MTTLRLSGFCLATFLLGFAGFVGTVQAALPPADAFDIRYYATDENGESDAGNLMVQSHMQAFVNRARCECGQDIRVRVTLTQKDAYDNVQLVPMVGNQCSQGENLIGGVAPCAQFPISIVQDFNIGKDYKFDPIWLSTGVKSADVRSIDDATPKRDCSGGQGQGGLWMCANTNGTPGCQSDEFFITGAQNSNLGKDATAQGISFDFDPPVNLPNSVNVSSGDGSLIVKWQLNQASGDTYGFRVLCADEQGNPVSGHGVKGPDITYISTPGSLYFTKGNLCPNGPFGEDDGGTTGDELGTTTEAGSTTVEEASSSTTSSEGSTTSSQEEFPAEGIKSLDWSYVCSPNIASTMNQVRISGLQNNQPYQVLLVAYDKFGNPAIASEILTATPVETYDFWEQCEKAGTCGRSGFCSVLPQGGGFAFVWLLVPFSWLLSSRRRHLGLP